MNIFICDLTYILKRKWIIILSRILKNVTKENAKNLNIIIIPIFLIMMLVILKYKPAYEVFVNDEKIGLIENKKNFESKVEEFINSTSENVLFREAPEKTKYELRFINRNIKCSNDAVLLSMQDRIETTYRIYAILVDKEEKAVVATEEEAKNLVQNMKKNIDEKILDVAIIEKYTTDFTVESQEDADVVLTKIKEEKKANYKTELIKAKKLVAIKEAKNKNYATVGNIAGINLKRPIEGVITSRFGNRSSRRSGAHTGLDISAPSGTTITPIASGKVTFAGSKGSYGNLVIIDHGNGIESYYAHCSVIFTTVGQNVDVNTAISAVGSTGNSTGPHLHLEIHQNGIALNPEEYLY